MPLLSAILVAGIVSLPGCHDRRGTLSGDGYHFDRRGVRVVKQSNGKIGSQPEIVQIDNRFGRLRVEATDGPSQLEWSWSLTVWAEEAPTASRLSGEIQMRIEQDGGRCRFTLELPPPPEPQLRGVESNLTLKVPPTVKVALANGFDRTEIRGVQGGTFARCRHGSLHLDRLGGSVDAATEFGDLHATQIPGAKLKDRHGDVRVRQVDGDLEVDSQHGVVDVEQVAGKLSVLNRHGDVTARKIAEQAEIETTFADIRLEDVAGEVLLQNEHGDISGKQLSGNIDATNRFGEIELRADSAEVICRNDHGRIHLTFSGDKLHRVEAQTSFGELRVKVPESVSPQVAAATSFGEIHSDLPVYMTDVGADAFRDLDPSTARMKLKNEHGNIWISQ
jgi:DUF4097 and DUF4098 domain-containing protein YvlB